MKFLKIQLKETFCALGSTVTNITLTFSCVRGKENKDELAQEKERKQTSKQRKHW